VWHVMVIVGCSVGLRFGLAGLVGLESRINDSICFKSRDEYIEYPEEHKTRGGHSLHGVYF